MLSKVMILARQTFKNYPLATNSVIYGSLIVTAEFSQQTVNKKILLKPTEPYDTVAFGRYAAYGTGIAGPLLFVWFKWLDRKYVGVASRIVTKKILLDQFFFTPQLCVIFYVAMSIMEHKEDILKECKEKFTPTFIKSCCFWLPAQTVNFLMVPPQFRVIYVATCSFAWVNILCWMKRQ